MRLLKNAIIKLRDAVPNAYDLFLLKRKKVRFGRNLAIKGIIGYHGKGQVEFGDNVVIISSPNVNVTGGGYRTQFNIWGGHLNIGNNVGISHAAITAKTGITIEDNVLIGTNCLIVDTDFHSIQYSHRMETPDTPVVSKPILIKEGAFIGARCIILKGVTIGKHSIVGAGSVISKDVPDGEIWAGNPARFIRKVE